MAVSAISCGWLLGVRARVRAALGAGHPRARAHRRRQVRHSHARLLRRLRQAALGPRDGGAVRGRAHAGGRAAGAARARRGAPPRRVLPRALRRRARQSGLPLALRLARDRYAHWKQTLAHSQVAAPRAVSCAQATTWRTSRRTCSATRVCRPPARSTRRAPSFRSLSLMSHHSALTSSTVRVEPLACAVQHKATLSYEEEERVARVLQQLADEVLRRRLQLWPFFRDFDRVRH